MTRRFKVLLTPYLGFILALTHPVVARAAEVTVFCSTVFQAVVAELAPQFEKAAGDRLTITFDSGSVLKGKIDVGEPFDVVILASSLIADLAREGKVVDGSVIALARAGVGIAVKKGAARPDIASVDGFRRALTGAATIVYNSSGLSGRVFLSAIEKLGIASEVTPRAKVIPAGATGDVVARGDADMAVQLVPELLSVSGVDVVGPFPSEMQSYFVLSAGIAAAARERARAQALITFLHAPGATPVIKAKGMEPN